MKNKLLETSSWIINHLGINPVKGGRPPNDKRAINDKSLISGEKLVWLNKWEVWNASW